ncbi:PKD domain-containing protein, partial [Croceitalea dokdonensis]|uniref:PKD domain-containing protein n=1 Tax=Croceitalea dokdonensis TaxID=346188 RepID=UPI000B0C65FE
MKQFIYISVLVLTSFVTFGQDCTPISTLPCNQVDVTLPVNLTFDGTEGGILATGFTMVDPPTSPLAADEAINDDDVPGLIADNLSISGGLLNVEATKGINFRQTTGSPNSTETNSQMNALGVGFIASSNVIDIEATFATPDFSTTTPVNGSQQAGIWFGLNENNFAKLVLVNRNGDKRVQLAVEQSANGLGGNGQTLTIAEINVDNVSITGINNISLRISVDPNTNTVTGFYSLDGAPEVQVVNGTNALAIPSTFLQGTDHDNNVTTDSLSFAGIMTSTRRATAGSLNISYDSFSVMEDVPTPPATVTAPYRINVAGGDYTLNGDLFIAEDTSYLVGSSSTSTNFYPVVGGNGDLYIPRRFADSGADFGYAFPIANGDYQVAVHMVENFLLGTGLRVFDVNIEGSLVIDDLDLFAVAGEKTPYIETIDVTVTDGELNIDFESVVDNAIVMAIEVLPAPVNLAPSITSAATVSVPENQTAVIDVEANDDNDSEGSGLSFALSGGVDDTLFSLDAGTGVLTFLSAPDFETPGDDNTDNTYNVQVTVTDSGLLTALQDIAITVTDEVEGDITSPIITLLGDNPLELIQGDSYNDPGATAEDDLDGDITANIVVGGDVVDTNTIATYTVTYDVSDIAGNPATQVARTVNVSAPSGFSFVENFDYPIGDLSVVSSGAWAPEGLKPDVPVVATALTPGSINSVRIENVDTTVDYLTLINNPVELSAGVPFYYGTYFKFSELGSSNTNRVRVAVRVDGNAEGEAWVRQIIGNYGGSIKARLGLGGPSSNAGEQDVYADQLLQFVVKGVWDGSGSVTYEYTLSPTLSEGDNNWIEATTSQSITGTPKLARIFIGSTSIGNTGNIGPIRLSTDYSQVVTELVNSEPNASFTSSISDLTVDLDASDSQDDGTIASYSWNFGDGNTATGQTTSHQYTTGGTYTISLTVTDDGGLTDTTTQEITVEAPFVATFPYQINFQDANTTPPTGYVKDFGLPYGVNEGGLTYGWIKLSDGLPVNLSVPSNGTGRNRGEAGVDLLLNTLVHVQGNDISSWSGGRSNEGVWEIELPNGWYEVTVSVGDPATDNNPDDSPKHFINVEGETAIPLFVVDPNLPAGDSGRFQSNTVIVEVLDGKLTIDADNEDAFRTKINYATIAQATDPRSSENDILTFNLDDETGTATIDATAHEIVAEVTNGTVLTALTPTITISGNATIVPSSGTAQDFTNSVVYTVTAENGDEQDWTVTVTAAAPALPQIVINEIMQNPDAVDDTEGEWLELYNAGSTDVNIEGWTLQDNGTNSHVIANGSPLVIPTGGYLVLGNNAEVNSNGGKLVDYAYSGYALANGADEIILFDADGNEIDRVEYDGGINFPNPTGASMALNNPTDDNNDGANWSTAIAAFGIGDLGTPGVINDGKANETPVINSLASVDAQENQTLAIDVDATDVEDDPASLALTFTLSGGNDAALFDIDTSTGEVSFLSAPDFETPGDDNSDNTYNIQVTVTDSGSLTAQQDIAITVTDVVETFPFVANINFQNNPSATTPPTGYVADYGKEFGNSVLTVGTNNYNYGWKLASDGSTPIDISNDDPTNGAGAFAGAGRNRIAENYSAATLQEKLEGTLVHFQGDNIGSWVGQPRGNEVIWELEVPNGVYEITLGLGDKSTSVDSRHSATLEGYTIIPAFVPTPGQTVVETMVVEVTDGLLTMTGLGGFNSKITHIEVVESTALPVNGTLVFNPATISDTLAEGATGTFTSDLSGPGATNISLTIDDNTDETGTNDWVTLPPAALGPVDFFMDTSSLGDGDTRSNSIIATAKGFEPAVLNADLTVTEAQLVEITAPYRINVGGADYSLNGDLFTAEDTSYLVGTSDIGISDYGVVGGNGDLYHPRRFADNQSDFGYAFPIANGNYQVALHMVENLQTATGARIFDVTMEDVLVIDDLDLFAVAGEKTPYIETIAVAVTDGELNIDFTSVVNNAIIMAIEVLPAPALNVETDIVSFTLTDETGAATIDTAAHTVSIEVENGTELTTLSPTIVLSAGATVSPLSGTPQDFSSPFDYTVTAEDGTTQQVWTVTVTEAAPQNSPPVVAAQTFNVSEDVAIGTLVGTVLATDDEALTYVITNGNEDGVFVIGDTTGELSTLQLLDFETASQYTLTVSVSDGELSETAEITIDVTDVNEIVPCNPLSILDCEAIVVSLPVNFDFSSEVDGTLLESGGLGTGFTVALEHSEARRAGDLPISNADVNGYEPSLLTLTNGQLQILSQAGIAFRNPPESANNNNQVNTLGVGLENVTQPITIQTTLLNIVTGGGSAQGGIWFGYDEDNFVKLNVNNNNIELRTEVNGFSTDGDPVQGGQVQEALGASGNDVVLELRIDPLTLQAEAFYTIGTGTRTLLGSLPIPADYFAGRDIDPLGGQDNVTFAGIYATHRNGTQFTASFDDFAITEETVQPTLTFDVPELNFTVEENGNVPGQTAILTATPENANLLIDYSLESAQSWVLTPTSSTTGQVTFNIDASELPPGDYSEIVFAQDIPDLGYDNAEITINLTVTPESNDFAANINFSDPATVPPADYLQDSGDAFGNRNNGFSYGWLETDGTTPLDLTSNGRNRDVNVDILQKTLMHMQYGDTGGTLGNATEGVWEITIPNGTYLVTVGVGDATSIDSEHTINAEGVNLVDGFIPSGTGGAPTQFTTGAATVVVNDGRLTLDASGGTNTKINYATIVATDGQPQSPRVVGVIPNDGSTGISVNTNISANDLFLPNGAPNNDGVLVFGVDNSTINTSTVQLFKVGEQNPIASTVNGTGGGDAINLNPNLPLESNTTYIFRIDGVTDLSGEPFEVFESTFSTGSGNTGGNTDLDNVAFDNDGVVGSAGKYTTLTIGPDNKLYALKIDGDINRYDIAADGTLVNEEVLSAWKSAYASRAAIGLVFDPSATANNLVAYVSHQSGGLSGAPEWDGKISRISGANLQTEEVLVTDLPRSIRDHLTNSIAFRPGEPNALYFNQGSNSAGGAPDGSWGNRPERMLSAATLKLDLSKLPATLPLNVRTTQNIDAIKNVDVNSPLLDNLYNPYYVDAPLTLYATGIRNAYDLAWHSNGQLYVPTNGTAGGSNTPASIDDMPRPDGTVYDHDDVSGNYPIVPASNGNNTQRDWLFRVDPNSSIGYYGHPNPFRGEFVMNRGDADVSNSAYNGVVPDINYRGAAYDFEFNKSPNGVIEYKSDAENGNLQGALLVVRYSGSSDIIALVPDGPNGDIGTFKEGIPGFGGFADPLDLIEDTTNGNIYVSDFGRDQIVLLKPRNAAAPSPVIVASTDNIVGDAVASGSETYQESIVISNLGNADLENIQIQITGPDSGDFEVIGLPSVIAPQNSDSFVVSFDPSSVGPKFAQLEISGTNADTIIIDLNGLGKEGLGGSNEPSLQWILDTHLGSGVVNVGDTDATTNLIDLPNGSTYNDLIGDEIDAQTFVRAIEAPITLEVLSVYGPTANNPIVAFGWYPAGDNNTLTELFTVDNSPASNGQTLNAPTNGVLEFDPGIQEFGFYSEWPFFNNRQLFSQDVLNTFADAIPHHIRVYDLPGEDDAYIIATEEHISGFDYQDIVVVARNIRPAAVDPIAGCFPISTLECNEIEVALPFNLTFDGTEGGLANTGFTMVDNPSQRIPEDGTISNPDVPGFEPDQLAFSNGNLIVTANKGIAFVEPGTSTETNSQINTLGVGIDASSYGNFSISTTIVNPYTDGDNNSEQAGIWFGLDEDNFVKLVAVQNGEVEIRSEVNAVSANNTDNIKQVVNGLNNSVVSLRLFVDLDNDLLTGFYALDGGTEVELGSLDLPAAYINGNSNYLDLSFAGIFATKRREDVGTLVEYTFEDFAIQSDNMVAFNPVNINFSLPGDVPPVGYEVDSGLGYGLRENGLNYGWLTVDGQTSLDLSQNARNRGVAGIDILQNTLVHMQYGDVNNGSGTNGVNTEGIWELEVPNGTYNVSVGVGDPEIDGENNTPSHTINVEGTNIIDSYVPTGPEGSATRFTSGTATVTVSDGRLTIDANGGFNTKINALEVTLGSVNNQPFFTNVTPANNAVDVALEELQINVELVVPAGYELDENTIAGNISLFEVTANGEILVPSNANDTGGGDAITLTPIADLKEFTTYIFRLSGNIEANLIGDINDRLNFIPFESTFTTGELDDTSVPARDLTGVEFIQVFGDALLGPGTENQRFSSLTIGPDGKLYASTIGDFQSDGQIYRWDMAADGTLSNLEILSPELNGAPHPVTGPRTNNDRLIIGFDFDPNSTADNLVAYITHSAASVTNGPEWDGVLTKLSGPDLSTVEDLVIHLPRSTKDHLTNSLAFDPQGDMYITQGSNSAGGEPDGAWGFRPERLLAAAILKVELDKLTGITPLSVFTTDNIDVINSASTASLTMGDGTYNPYATNAPVTIFATGVRNAYDLTWHSNGWLYIPTNGTAGNNSTSPNSPATSDYLSATGEIARRIDGRTLADIGGDIPALNGGETQKDWLFKSQGGSYHGHPNPYRGEFVLNHGGVPYSGIPGQVGTDTDVAKYPDNLGPDPNYRSPAYDFAFNKSPNGVIEYKSDAFDGKLQGLLFVTRFSGQDDLLGLDPKLDGDIQDAYNSIPGLSGFDDPLDVVEDPLTGNMYISEYDRVGGGTPRLTLLRAAVPATTGPEIAANPEELIFEITVNNEGENTDVQTVAIENLGNEVLNITDATISGAFASQFNSVSPGGAQTINPGESLEYTVTYAPDLNSADLGYQEAVLEVSSDDVENPIFTVGLHALKKAGFEGGQEPPLQDVVDALGIGIDVGWTNLAIGTDPQPIGDEVEVEFWVKAGNQPVEISPVGRYSPAEELPFGWFVNNAGDITLNEIGVLANGIDNAQTLFPPLISGTNSFDPQGAVFGLYTDSNAFNRINYTQDAINTGGVAHRTRIYPNKDRDGNVIENSYLVTFEDATNGDYQDYMFVLTGVTPFEDGILTLSVNPEQLDFTVAINQENVSTQNIVLTGTGGITSQEVTLVASEDWLTLPSVELGAPLAVGIDAQGLGIGNYTATITASAPNYADAIVTVNLTITNEVVYIYQFNFQDPDDIAVSPDGYVDDIGAAYGLQTTSQGEITFGWVLPGTETPADASASARNRGGDALLTTFNIIGHRTPASNPTRDWLIEVPNGTYYANISVGDPDFSDSHHVLDVNGVTVIDYDQENTVNGPVSFENTELVVVTDGKLRLSLGEGGENAKPNYIRLAPFDQNLVSPVITASFDGNESAPNTFRGPVAIELAAADQNGSGITSLQFVLDGAALVDYTNPIIVTDLGVHILEVSAEDGNGNSSSETFNFTIEAATGALLAIENMTKIPGTDRGFPAEDYFTFHRIGTNLPSEDVHDVNVMRLNNPGTTDLSVSEINISNTNAYTFELVDDLGTTTTLPLTIAAGSFVDVVLTFQTATGGTRTFTESIEIVSNADNAVENTAVLHGAYSPQSQGNSEITAQEVFDAFGFQSSMLSIVNDEGTIDPPNNITFRPSSNFPDEDNINAGYEGDMILADAFVQADPNQPVIGMQISALHGPGSNGARLVEVNGTGTVAGMDFSHDPTWFQTLLPRAGSNINFDTATTISEPFRIAVVNYLNSGGNNINGNRPDLLGLRVYKVIDYKGNVLPNEYIVLQDFIGGGCGAGSANCDWNDNTFYFINIRPEAVPTATPLDNLFVAIGESFSSEVLSVFDRGYAGNTLEYTVSYQGGALPAWAQFDAIAGTISGIPTIETQGDYTFDIVGTDSNGLTASTSLTITINEPPVATDDTATTQQNVAIQLVDLLANDSEPNGEELNIVSVGNPLNGEAILDIGTNGVTYTPNFDFIGSDSFDYVVEDESGLTATATVNVTVTGADQPPVAVAEATPTNGAAALFVQFTGSNSTDDNGIVLYEWNFGDNSPISSDADATHTYTSPGTYEASLTVTDGLGQLDVATLMINVSSVANAPIASASTDVSGGVAPLTVDFTGDASLNAVSYLWDFGDGNTSNLENPQFVFVEPGSYEVVLTITGNTG